MSQAIFARALNVTPSVLSKWERGGISRTAHPLKRLALAAHKGIDTIP